MKLLIIFLLTFALVGCSNNNNNDNNSINENTSSNYDASTLSNPQIIEEDVSNFSTPITIKDSARQNNIQITTSKLNGTVVKSNETFSFCNTVGKATAAEGYQEADIFDKDGNVIKGYGGGNCQVSSTLYNAVLNMSGISIIERHEHSRKS